MFVSYFSLFVVWQVSFDFSLLKWMLRWMLSRGGWMPGYKLLQLKKKTKQHHPNWWWFCTQFPYAIARCHNAWEIDRYAFVVLPISPAALHLTGENMKCWIHRIPLAAVVAAVDAIHEIWLTIFQWNVKCNDLMRLWYRATPQNNDL